MSSLFGSKSAATPVAPVAAPPAKMPDPDDPGVVEAKRRAQRDAMTRGGRTSTILTGKSVGGGSATPTFDSYGGSSLGSGA